MPQFDPSMIQAPGVEMPQRNIFQRVAGGIGDRVGGALTTMREDPEARMASIYTALQLLGAGSGNGLNDLSRAATNGLGVYQQGKQLRTENERKAEEMKQRAADLKLKELQIEQGNREMRQRGYIAEAELKGRTEDRASRERIAGSEMDMRRDISRQETAAQLEAARLRVAGMGDSKGAIQLQAEQIAKAMKAKYPGLSEEEATLQAYYTVFTRFGASDPANKAPTGDPAKIAATYYENAKEKLFPGETLTPEQDKELRRQAIAWARETQSLAGTSGDQTDLITGMDRRLAGFGGGATGSWGPPQPGAGPPPAAPPGAMLPPGAMPPPAAQNLVGKTFQVQSPKLGLVSYEITSTNPDGSATAIFRNAEGKPVGTRLITADELKFISTQGAK
jgi:hypothetical protein